MALFQAPVNEGQLQRRDLCSIRRQLPKCANCLAVFMGRLASKTWWRIWAALRAGMRQERLCRAPRTLRIVYPTVPGDSWDGLAAAQY
jgi:hypothetical protein